MWVAIWDCSPEEETRDRASRSCTSASKVTRIAHAAGAGRAAHSGTVRSRQRSAPLGSETGRARRQEREETSHYWGGAQAGGLAASAVDKRRGLRTIAEQPTARAGSRVMKGSSLKNRCEAPAPSSGDCVNRLAQLPSAGWNGRSLIRWQHRLKREHPTGTGRPIAHKECGWKGGDSGNSAETISVTNKKQPEPT